jgi:hypothetical protein
MKIEVLNKKLVVILYLICSFIIIISLFAIISLIIDGKEYRLFASGESFVLRNYLYEILRFVILFLINFFGIILNIIREKINKYLYFFLSILISAFGLLLLIMTIIKINMISM